MIVRTSFEHECTDTLEIPFKFYVPFDVTLEISTDSQNKELCLSSETGEEVTLTAGMNPENRKPEPVYYWYESFNGAPFVEMEGNPTSETTKKRIIDKNDNGKYAYKVVAIDNICFSSYGAATEGENVGEDFFDAYKPIDIKGIVTSAEERNDTVCPEDELTFTATIENPRAGINYEWTSTHEGSPKTGSFSVTEATTTVTFTIGKVLGKGQVTLSITDGLCNNTALTKNYYTFTSVQKPEIEDVGDLSCVKTENQTINLQVKPTVGALKYEWYKKGSDNILGEGTTVDVPLIPNGKNTFYVKAVGECDTDTNEITITTREPLVLSNLNVTEGTLTTCAFEAPEVCLEITPSLAQSWDYRWEVMENDDTTYHTSAENTKCMTIPLGTKGQVRVSVFDELCDMRIYSNPRDYDIQDDISIELTVKDIDGLAVSDEWLCEDSVILEVKILAGGTTGNYTWTWFDNGTEVKKEQGLPTPRRIKLTPGLWEYAIEAAKAGACDARESKPLGTNLIMPIQPTISIKGKDRDRFCSTDEPLELEVTIGGGLDPSNINFEWWSVNGGSLVSSGPLATYHLPNDFNYSSDVSIAVKAAYEGDRGSRVCSQNTATLDLTIQNPIEIKMRENEKGEYDICLDEPYREVALIVDIFDGRPDSLYWYKNGSLDTVSAVNGLDSIARIVRVVNSEKFTVLAKDSICGDRKEDGGVEISVTPVPGFKLVIEPDVIEINQHTQLSAIINDSIRVSDSTYTWTNALGWKDETPEYQTNSGDMLQEGIYTFTVDTKFGNCYLTAEADLEVLELITNIITPYNRNGKNDIFMGPKGKRPGYKMEIFNRYQQKIFEGDNGWDGTYRGQLAEPGTYFYRIQMQSGRIMKGTVEVAKF